MSHAAHADPVSHAADHGKEPHAHDPHLAHHFESLDQQFTTSKLGMWTFLATEILMFGGLFVLYSVYRANNPEVYKYAHSALNTNMGAINTAILLASSFTMAWAVRCSQLGQRSLMLLLIVLTFLGGVGFMSIKYFEYEAKIKKYLWVGTNNAFSTKAPATTKIEADKYIVSHKTAHGSGDHGTGDHGASAPHAVPATSDHGTAPAHDAPAKPEAEVPAAPPATHLLPAYMLPSHAAEPAGTPDNVKHAALADALKPPAGVPAGAASAGADVLTYSELRRYDQDRVNAFFSIYYMMTGLHGLHVLVGMGLMVWLIQRGAPTTIRPFVGPLSIVLLGVGAAFAYLQGGMNEFQIGGWALMAIIAIGSFILAVVMLGLNLVFRNTQFPEGEFGAHWYTPIDLGGLYWHLVDLIWIFLFPLLYLIH